MPKKLCRNRSLRAVIDQQLAVAAEEIFNLLKERGQAKLERLRELVSDYITAAVEGIITAVRAAERESEEPEGRAEEDGEGQYLPLCMVCISKCWWLWLWVRTEERIKQSLMLQFAQKPKFLETEKINSLWNTDQVWRNQAFIYVNMGNLNHFTRSAFVS